MSVSSFAFVLVIKPFCVPEFTAVVASDTADAGVFAAVAGDAADVELGANPATEFAGSAPDPVG
jgi:hypothetical protein